MTGPSRINILLLLLVAVVGVHYTNAITLDAGTAGAQAICAVTGGCTLQALYALSNAGTIPAGSDLVVSSSSAATIAVNAATEEYDSLVLSGSITLAISSASRLSIDELFSISSSVIVNVAGILETATTDTDDSAASLINGTVNIQTNGVANFYSGLNTSTGANINIAASGSMTIGFSPCVIQCAINTANNSTITATKSTIYLSNNIVGTASSTLVLANATLYLTATASITAAISLTGESIIQAQGVAATVAKLVVSGGNNTIISAQAAAFTISNSITVASNSALELVGNVIASNSVNVQGTLIASAFSPNSPTYAGTSTQLQGSLTATGAGSVVKVNVNATLSAQQSVSVSGTLILLANATYQATTTTHNIQYLVVSGVAAVVIASTNAAVAVLSTTTVQAGASVAFSGSITIAGSYFTASGDVTFGTFVAGTTSKRSILATAASTTNVQINAPSSFAGLFQVNAGSTVTINAQANINGTVVLARRSALNIVSGVTYFKNGVVAYGNVTVTSTLVVVDTTASWTQQEGVFALNNGIITATNVYIGASGATNYLLAGLVGVGTVQGNLYVYASISVGFSPGTLQVSGNLLFGASSASQMELASDSSYDRINVNGSCTRAGTLAVTLLNSYRPKVHTSYTYLTFSSGSGTFSPIVNYPANGYTFTESDSQSASVITSASHNAAAAVAPAAAAVCALLAVLALFL